MDEPQPASLPQEINSHPEAMILYRIAFVGLSVIPFAAIVSAVILALFGQALPTEAWLLASAALAVLGTAINGQNAKAPPS